MGMESENAQFLRQGLVETYRKMTPVERLQAFVNHSRLMLEFKRAGDARRESLKEGKPLNG
jgi:hypothetical protein